MISLLGGYQTTWQWLGPYRKYTGTINNKSLFSQYGPAQACSLTGTSESQRPGQFVPF